MQSAQSAAYRRPAESSARTNADRFDYELGTIANRLRNSIPDLADPEKRLLEDYARGAQYDAEPRYRMVTFRRLCAIARRSRKAEDREALSELVRTEVFADLEPMPLAVAFDQETGAVGPCDVAQRQFEMHPTPMTLASCKAALARQLAVTKAAYDAVVHYGRRHLNSSST